MVNLQMISDEERVVDPILGYPKGYAKLCRHAHNQIQGLITPFTKGPPQRFQPYISEDHELKELKGLDALFPVICEDERDVPNSRKHANALWSQLDHLGRAGFDPEKFRVDRYGNVLYWHADPKSPLFWEVDHWFPHSRGGKTVPGNLRIVQWQVNQRKHGRLEFLVPWWDLQLGVSVNQFLSAFASKNADFRQRCFSFLFGAGQHEELIEKVTAASHVWPNHFHERKAKYGLAAAALTKVSTDMDEELNVCLEGRISATILSTPGRRRWSLEEEEALRRALQKFGPGNWKEIKESESHALKRRSTVQIKDKYRLMKEDWNLDKENVKKLSTSLAVQKEMQLRQIREEDRREKDLEVARIEENLKRIKAANEEEQEALDALEATLIHNQKDLEKQRRWAEMQASYRLSLERMIRDVMHQSIIYKEQARLNQAACNALMARLDTQNASCLAAEVELLKYFKERKVLNSINHPEESAKAKPLNVGDIVDVSSCLSQPLTIREIELLTAEELEGANDNVEKDLSESLLAKEALANQVLMVNRQIGCRKQEGGLQSNMGEALDDGSNAYHSSTCTSSCNADSEDEMLESQSCPMSSNEAILGKQLDGGSYDRHNYHSSTSLSFSDEDSKQEDLEIERDNECPENELEVVVVGYEYGCHSTTVETLQQKLEKEDMFVIGDANFLQKESEEDKELGNETEGTKEMAQDFTQQVHNSGKANVNRWLDMLLHDKSNGIHSGSINKLSTVSSAKRSEHQDNKPRGIIGGFFRKLNFRPTGETEPSKSGVEWDDLATKMGNISFDAEVMQVHDSSDIDQGCPIADMSSEVSEFNSPENVCRRDGRTVLQEDGKNSNMNLSDASDISSPINGFKMGSENGLGIQAEDICQEWSAKEQAKNGVKQSIKACTQAWTKAMKKLEGRIQDGQ